jgi:hypothetical protein
LPAQLAARRNATLAVRIRRPEARRIASVATGAIGAILLVHAVLLVVLALTTSTVTFLAVSRPVSWVVVGGGLAALVLWIRRQRPGRWDGPGRPGAPGPPAEAGRHRDGTPGR